MSGRSHVSESDENSSEDQSIYPESIGRLWHRPDLGGVSPPSCFTQFAQTKTDNYDSPYMPGLCSSVGIKENYKFCPRRTEVIEITEEDIVDKMETTINIPVNETIPNNNQQNDNNSQESPPSSQDYFGDDEAYDLKNCNDDNFDLNLSPPLTPLPPHSIEDTNGEHIQLTVSGTSHMPLSLSCEHLSATNIIFASNNLPSQISIDHVSPSGSPSHSICLNSDSDISCIVNPVLLPKFVATNDSGISGSSEIQSDSNSQNEHSSEASSEDSDVSDIHSIVLLPNKCATSTSSVLSCSKNNSDVRSFSPDPLEHQIPPKILTNIKNNPMPSSRDMPDLESLEIQQPYSPTPQLAANNSEINENNSETGSVNFNISKTESTVLPSPVENNSETNTISSPSSDPSENQSQVMPPLQAAKTKNFKFAYYYTTDHLAARNKHIKSQKRKMAEYEEPPAKKRKNLKIHHFYISILSKSIQNILAEKLIDIENKDRIIHTLAKGISHYYRDTYTDTTTTDTE